MFRRGFLAGATLAAGLCGTMAGAQDVLLTVSGDVQGETRTFTDADLMALPQVSFTTGTIWTEAASTFSGPTLASVLEAAGAGDGDLRLSAINDYTVEMARGMVSDVAPIVATRIDGESFSVREKGPLWIVFPYDSGAEYQSELVYAVSVWQLVAIEVQ